MLKEAYGIKGELLKNAKFTQFDLRVMLPCLPNIILHQ